MLRGKVNLKNRLLQELTELCCYSVAKISGTKFYKLIIK